MLPAATEETNLIAPAKPEEYKECLEMLIDSYLYFSPNSGIIKVINELYNKVYAHDESIGKYKKDIDIINQGKAILDDDKRELTDKEIDDVVTYIKRDPKCDSVKERETLERIAKRIIKMRPEYERQLRFFFIPKYIY